MGGASSSPLSNYKECHQGNVPLVVGEDGLSNRKPQRLGPKAIRQAGLEAVIVSRNMIGATFKPAINSSSHSVASRYMTSKSFVGHTSHLDTTTAPRADCIPAFQNKSDVSFVPRRKNLFSSDHTKHTLSVQSSAATSNKNIQNQKIHAPVWPKEPKENEVLSVRKRFPTKKPTTEKLEVSSKVQHSTSDALSSSLSKATATGTANRSAIISSAKFESFHDGVFSDFLGGE